jgi:anthranilate phosphoribosyltransferase
LPAAVDFLARLSEGRSLTEDQTYNAVSGMLTDGWSDPEVAAFLAFLSAKGETTDELVGAARSLLDRAAPVPTDLGPTIDNCGTGGDQSGTFNVSTVTALVVAACGVKVAKHGNRSLSSKSGSADLFQEFGVDLDAPPERVVQSLRECGLAFFFAPKWHPAVAKIQPVRRTLKFRTIFNLVGPLANPVRPTFRFIGVGGDHWQGTLPARMARAVQRLGASSATVVVGEDGLDEVSLAGPTRVLRVTPSSIRDEIWTPEDFGLPRATRHDVQASSPAESADVARQVLANRPGPALDLVLANTAAVLLTAGAVESLKEGVELARRAIAEGKASATLDALVRCTQCE